MVNSHKTMLLDKIKTEIDETLAKYPNKRSAVMDILRLAERAGGGHLTKETMEEIASMLNMRAVEVNAAATFYSMYQHKPLGRNHIWVCRNLSCSLMGAEHVIEYIEKKLSIKNGETTSDKKFTLDTAECLGSCGTAPMMQINDDYYENLTEEKIDAILAKMK